MKLFSLVCGGLFLLFAGAALAQNSGAEERDRLYVTDQLRLSLYSNADSSSQILQYLSSGDVLLVEELSGAYALVTVPDGTRGWVKRGFLVSKPTANLQLIESQRINEELTAEIEKLGNSKTIIDQYEKDLNELAASLETLELEKQQAAETIAGLEQVVEQKQIEIDMKKDNQLPSHIVLTQTFKNHWKMIAPLIVVIVLLTFLISKIIIESHIKSKFHGIKIW